MYDLFRFSAVNFVLFLIAGLIIVFLILKYDKLQRRKMNLLLKQTSDVEPIYKVRAVRSKLKCMDMTETSKTRRIVAKELDHLVAEYDSGHITLPDYCTRLNRLLTMMNNN